MRGSARTRFFVDRRESTVNESGDYLMALREGAIDESHIVAELGEVLAGLAQGRTSPDEITAFKSLGIAVEDLAAAELAIANAETAGIGDGGALVTGAIPIEEIRAAREVLAGTATRTPLVRLAGRRSGRDPPQAREPAADRLVQDPRRVQRDEQAHARGAGGRA